MVVQYIPVGHYISYGTCLLHFSTYSLLLNRYEYLHYDDKANSRHWAQTCSL